MDQEYEQIREGLLALMCVGDHVGLIVSTLSRQYNCLAVYTIEDVLDDKTIIVTDQVGTSFGVKVKSLEVHNGMIYSWEVSPKHYPYRSIARIKKMIEILESKDIRNIN
jgi:hypothetical protein